MTKIIILGVLGFVFLAVLAIVLAKLKASVAGKSDVYCLRRSLFTPAERSFLGVLDPLLPADVRLFGKVRLEDIFGVKSGLDRAGRTTARNRINRKHVDFLLVRAQDLSPIAGIELDDSSHDAEDRQERDLFVDQVFSVAGLPLIRFPAQKSYAPKDVLKTLNAAIDARNAPASKG